MEGVDRIGQQKLILELLQECIEVSAVAMYQFTTRNFIRCYTARVSELRDQGHVIDFDKTRKIYVYKGKPATGQLVLNLN